MSVFSERLRSVMKERGISQAQLSALTDIPKSAISQYLSRKFKPKQERVYLICRALDISPAWLTGYEDTQKSYDSMQTPRLSSGEYALIRAYRMVPDFKQHIDTILFEEEDDSRADIFRAAKSDGGTVAPSREGITAERLRRLTEAPETDEDL